MVDNALAQLAGARRAPSPPGGDPMQMALDELQRITGMRPTTPEELQAAVDVAWERAPTDGVGEMIDMIARQTGIQPPWGKPSAPGTPLSPPQAGAAEPQPAMPNALDRVNRGEMPYDRDLDEEMPPSRSRMRRGY